MKRYRHFWIWIVVGGYIWLIFRNSMMIADASNTMSLDVMQYLLQFVQKFGLYAGDYSLFHHWVRKLAHFTEFAGLGFLVSLAIQICPLLPSRFLNFALFLTAIPFADEYIQQYFDGRSCQLSDMIIDGAGFIAGALLCYILALIIRDLFRKTTG